MSPDRRLDATAEHLLHITFSLLLQSFFQCFSGLVQFLVTGSPLFFHLRFVAISVEVRDQRRDFLAQVGRRRLDRRRHPQSLGRGEQSALAIGRADARRQISPVGRQGRGKLLGVATDRATQTQTLRPLTRKRHAAQTRPAEHKNQRLEPQVLIRSTDSLNTMEYLPNIASSSATALHK